MKPMKKVLLMLVAIYLYSSISAQIETSFFPDGDAFKKVKFINEHPKPIIIKKLPTFDAQKLIDNDKSTELKDAPFRFGKEFDVNLTLNDGAWAELDSGRLWSIEFFSKGAFSINFIFENFHLSDGAELYITNSSGTMLYGPVTSKQITNNGFFLTDLIKGDDVFVYLFEPYTEKGISKLTIKRAVHAYKNLYPDLINGNLGGSLSCNNNIACYTDYSLESDAVALVLLSSGAELC
jgi:lysyl endopeptidase